MTIEQFVPENFPNHQSNANLILLNLLTDTIKHLRHKNSEAEILQTSVEIVHQILKCDRVVIYSLLSESQGKIVAEALTPGFSPTLGSVIEDPCFQSRYIDLYQRGRVKATPNIYEAGMSACYIENLEQIEVKANLVIPLIHDNSPLSGLMVIHQCSDFRQWEQSEIGFAIQIAGWTAEQLEKLKKSQQLQSQLHQTTQWQNSLIKASHQFNLATKKSEVLQIGVNQVKEFLKCDRVVVYSLANPDLGKIVAESSIPSLASILGNVIQDSCFDYKYKAQYQKGRVKAVDNIYQANMSDCYVASLEKIAVKAHLVVPINLPNQDIYGLLVAHECFTFRKWQTQEIEWVKEIGIQMGAALIRTNLTAKIKSLATSFAKWNASKDSMSFAKNKTKQLGQSMQNTMITFSDISNLQNLLIREINSLNTPQETKVMQIIVRKIAVNIDKVKKSLSIFQADTTQIREFLDDVATNLYGIDSE